MVSDADLQDQKDRDERRGHEQGYKDGGLGYSKYPTWETTPYRKGYLSGHKRGRQDARRGVRFDVNS